MKITTEDPPIQSSHLNVALAELSNDDLFRIVNQDIVNYQAEEIELAYHELGRRELLATSIEKAPEPPTLLGFFIGLLAFGAEMILIHGEWLSLQRKVVIAAFVTLVANYWDKPKRRVSLLKWLLSAALIVLLGSLALWDIPLLLQPHIPAALAFGVPAITYSLAMFWMKRPLRPFRGNFTTWFIGCVVFTVLYTWLMVSLP